MEHIPPVPLVNPPKGDKLANRVARHNPMTYGGSDDLMALKEWIRGMNNIFALFKVLEEKRVNIRIFYLIVEVDI